MCHYRRAVYTDKECLLIVYIYIHLPGVYYSVTVHVSYMLLCSGGVSTRLCIDPVAFSVTVMSQI